jgi:signal transduction histidine kinase/CheY-like chemotaxis protein
MIDLPTRDDEFSSTCQEQLNFAIDVLHADGGVVISRDAETLEWQIAAQVEAGESPLHWIHMHTADICPWITNPHNKGRVMMGTLPERIRDAFVGTTPAEKPLGYCAASIVDGTGVTIGAVCVWFRTEKSFKERDCRLLETIAQQFCWNWERLQLREKVQTNEREKDEFLALLAHELRNPLAPISNTLQILRLLPDVNPHIHHLRELIERQVTHLLRLLNDLLDVSRIRRGIIRLQKAPVELNRIIQDASESCMTHYEERQHQLNITPATENLVIDGDADRLCQALANLLNNASRFMERGKGVQLAVTRAEQVVRLSILDMGAGIAAEALPRIFDLFSHATSASNRANSGLGVGLYLAQQIIKLHGGTLEARSDGIGKGSEFIVTLPLLMDRPSAESAPHVQDSESSSIQLKPCRVLVVDDTRASVYTLGRLLEMLGQKVKTANDAEGAMQQIKQEVPDIVITDIAMPKIDGYQLASWIRALPQGDRVILAAVTGFGLDSDRLRASQLGFDYFFTKPVGISDLRDMIKSIALRNNL